MAPITKALPSRLMPTSSLMPLRSTSLSGLERRIFIDASRVWPPASAWAAAAVSFAASARVVGRSRVNAYMVVAPWKVSGFGGLDGFPDAARRSGHVEVGHAQRFEGVEHGI